MTVRNQDLGSARQTLKWDSHNRLAQITGAGVSEGYRYGERGQRIRKTNLLTQAYTDYLFPNYERTSGGTVTKHYSFGGVAVAVRSGGGSPVFLYQDGVGSTVYTTDLNGAAARRCGLDGLCVRFTASQSLSTAPHPATRRRLRAG